MDKLKLICFYILSFTWGITLSLIGSFMILFLMITGHKPRLFHGRVYVEVKGNQGCNIGCFFICSKENGTSLKQHESGHGIQNAIFGPLTPFLITIPSGLRYQLREISGYKKKWVFGTVLTAILLSIGVVAYVMGAIFNIISLIVVSAVYILYIALLMDWLVLIETPRYKNLYLKYDDVWFERTATEWGKKAFPED